MPKSRTRTLEAELILIEKISHLLQRNIFRTQQMTAKKRNPGRVTLEMHATNCELGKLVVELRDLIELSLVLPPGASSARTRSVGLRIVG